MQNSGFQGSHGSTTTTTTSSSSSSGGGGIGGGEEGHDIGKDCVIDIHHEERKRSKATQPTHGRRGRAIRRVKRTQVPLSAKRTRTSLPTETTATVVTTPRSISCLSILSRLLISAALITNIMANLFLFITMPFKEYVEYALLIHLAITVQVVIMVVCFEGKLQTYTRDCANGCLCRIEEAINDIGESKGICNGFVLHPLGYLMTMINWGYHKVVNNSNDNNNNKELKD